MSDYAAGAIFSSTLPAWQQEYFERQLLDVVRMKSILVPFCAVKEDFAARNTGVMTYSEVYDIEPNWNSLSEQDIWLRGAQLDSRTVTLQMEVHGDTLKFSDYSEIVTYINNGNLKGLVRDKIGQSVRDTLDILARNAFLTHPNKVFAGGLKSSREQLAPTDIFDPDLAELARTHLEEADVPGVAANSDGDSQVIVCVTTPRVIHDIRTAAGSKWLEVQEYAGAARKFTAEVGMWGGTRFVKTNRLVMRNHGAVIAQTALAAATVPGQGAAQTVDAVYTVGQPNSVRFITVDDVTDFAVGDIVTIHSALVSAAGTPPLESDGTQETRRIVAIDAVQNRITFDKPLLKPHAEDDLVTKGVNVHASIFMGGPAVVYGIAERPHPIVPGKIDDLQMINRYGWRGFLRMQMFRPEFIEVHETSGTTD